MSHIKRVNLLRKNKKTSPSEKNPPHVEEKRRDEKTDGEGKDVKKIPKRKGKPAAKYFPGECQLCFQKFDSDVDLFYHIRDFHVKKEDDSKSKLRPKRVGRYKRKTPDEWEFECLKCQRKFKFQRELNEHRRSEHNQEPEKHLWVCEVCGKILKSKKSLEFHTNNSHMPKETLAYVCDVCSERFAYPTKFLAHRRAHFDDNRINCSVCDKKFKLPHHLKNHMRVHSDEKHYKCDECPKTFKSRTSYKAHKDTHLGVKRYNCSVCAREFLFQGNMVKHMRRRHKNEPPATKSDETMDSSFAVETNQNVESSMSSSPVPNAPCLSEEPCMQPSTFAIPPHTESTTYSNQLMGTRFHMGSALMTNSYTANDMGNQSLNFNSVQAFEPQITITEAQRGCRFCKQSFSDIQEHFVSYHRIPNAEYLNMQNILSY